MSTISSALNSTQPTSGAASGTTTGTISTSADALTSEQTFLKILVSQLQHQDPTSPTDPTQFVTQLTQYSSLEQLIGINDGIKKLDTQVTTNTTGTTGTNPTK